MNIRKVNRCTDTIKYIDHIMLKRIVERMFLKRKVHIFFKEFIDLNCCFDGNNPLQCNCQLNHPREMCPCHEFYNKSDNYKLLNLFEFYANLCY